MSDRASLEMTDDDARKVAYGWIGPDSDRTDVDALIGDIERALRAENERCARIAERFGSKPAPGNDGMGTRILLPVDGLQVAAAIRRSE